MNARTRWFCLALFAAGAAGGWLLPSGIRTQDQPTGKTGPVRRPPGPAAIPGLPEPSGLPGDLIHLTTITDTRTLRALWATAGDLDTRAALMERWAELDPADGFQYFGIDQVNGAPRDWLEATGIAEDWEARDPMAYLMYMNSIPGIGYISVSMKLSGSLDGLVDANPEAMMAFWKSASPEIKEDLSFSIFRYWFAHDPARALAEMEQTPRRFHDSIWLGVRQAAEPDAMLEILLKRHGANRNPSAVDSLIGKLAENDLPTAQAAAAKLPPGPSRTQACAKVVEHLSKSDPEAAWAWMEAEAPTNENRRVAGDALLEKDPVKAIALDPQGNWWPKSFPLERYATDLAKKDWPAMVGLAESVGPALRDQIIRAAAGSLAWDEGDPIPKLDQLGSLIAGFGGGRKILNDSFLDNLNPAQAPAIATWLNAQPEPVRQAFIEPMVERLQKESPNAAAAWLAGLPPGEVRTEHLLRTTADWAGTDPSAAAAFSLTLPPGPDRDYAILNTALAWHRNAPQAARAWLDGLPDSPAKTRAVQELDRGRN